MSDALRRATLDEALHAAARLYLNELLIACDGNVAEAARIAGRNRTEMYRVLRRYGLTVGSMRPELSLTPVQPCGSGKFDEAVVGP
jgi:DNA-binding NtrC family response regulator